MYKRVMALFLSILIVLSSSLFTFAFSKEKYEYGEDESGKCGKNAFYSYDGRTGILRIYGTGAIYNLNDNGFPAAFIQYTFNIPSNARSAIIEEGITSLGCSLFSQFSNLSSVTIAASVEELGNGVLYRQGINAFTLNISLQEINVSPDNRFFTSLDGVLYTKDLKTLIYYPPLRLASSFEIPSAVEVIGRWSFCYNAFLTGIRIPSTVIEVGEDAFASTFSIKWVIVEEGVKILGLCCFQDSASLRYAWLPASLETVGARLFQRTKLRMVVCLATKADYGKCMPFGVSADVFKGLDPCVMYVDKQCGFWKGSGLDSGAYMYNNTVRHNINEYPFVMKFSDFIMPSKLNRIDQEALVGVSAKRVYLPEGIEVIGPNAFSECPNLQQIFIPQTVETIADDAFASSSGLVIFGIPGSYADTYAKEHSLVFVDAYHNDAVEIEKELGIID